MLSKRSLGGVFLAAMAAGTCCVFAANAQTTTQKSSKSTRKSSSQANSHHSSSSTSHAATPNATSKAPAAKSAKGTSKSRKKKSKRVKGQGAPTPERINEIQDALARKGAFSGTPSGKWDDDTVGAMRKFQASNGLNPTGKLDAPTLQKLGLGSDTAGLGAPTPPPNSANRLLNSTSSPPEPPSQPRE